MEAFRSSRSGSASRSKKTNVVALAVKQASLSLNQRSAAAPFNAPQSTPPLSLETKTWQVCLHPDSGVPFYSSSSTSSTSWTDPFHPISDNFTTADAVAENLTLERDTDEHEVLAGFGLAPANNRLEEEECKRAQER